MIDGERWAVIYGGYYAVSDHGRVLSTFHRQSHCHLPAGVIMQISLTPKGYCQLNIRSEEYRSLALVHNLVAMAFIGEKPSGMTVNHKDGNKLNNHWLNLEYMTKRENTSHAWASGLMKTKLTEETVDQIRADHLAGIPQREIARRHDCSQSHVSGIVLGKSRVAKAD